MAYTASETTREKIIRAAGELAAAVGVDMVSTRAVADRAGENLGSIHYHFGGKRGLWRAVVEEAMAGGGHLGEMAELDALEPDAPPELFSQLIRRVVAREIHELFRSGRPEWHPRLIYQLIQRDDELYELFRANRLDPSLDFLQRLLQLIRPELDGDELFLHICLMRMPIFAHANFRPAMLKRLRVSAYSDEYLKKMENLLVRQTQRLLGLPEDEQ